MSYRLGELANHITNPYVKDWKKQDKAAVGYICSYIPREIIDAAGIMPFRIGGRSCASTTLADSVMAPITCSFSRCCLELALEGQYDFLDGLVSMNSCEMMRRMCDNWKLKTVRPFFYHCASVPHKSDEDAIHWYREELELLKSSLEGFFELKISNGDLNDAIKRNNETRHLLRRLHELQQGKRVMLSGADVKSITIQASAMPIEDYNRLLQALIGEINSQNGTTDYRARLMLIGCCQDDPNFTRIIEALGAVVVIDASCWGALSFWEPVKSAADPLEALARYYLTRVHCARMPAEHNARLNYIKEMAEAFNIDGIIFETMLHCTLWGGETMSLQKDIQKLHIPLLILDREYIPSGPRQLQTRLEAFLEMIEGGAGERS
jgi:benzoyl-CoA reductase/2-hydroxyglutaryl-CoA dehydratase subunit BcrC/BadD/HgdB